MGKTLQDRCREEAATPEFMRMYGQEIAEGMSQPTVSKDDVQIYNDYILYLQGQGPWKPEFGQHATKERN